MSDILNNPIKVTISGREYSVCELPYRKARERVDTLYKLVRGFVEANPGVDWFDMSTDVMQLVVSSAPLLAGGLADAVEETIAACTTTREGAPVDIGQLPLGDVVSLLAVVIQAHQGTIDGFFRLRAVIAPMLARRATPTPKPPSSPASSNAGSLTTR